MGVALDLTFATVSKGRRPRRLSWPLLALPIKSMTTVSVAVATVSSSQPVSAFAQATLIFNVADGAPGGNVGGVEEGSKLGTNDEREDGGKEETSLGERLDKRLGKTLGERLG